MPHRFLLQILRDLAKKGIVHPTRGGGGGFTLERPPDAISLLEAIEAIDGPLAAGRLGLGNLMPGIVQRIENALARASEVCRGHLRDVCLSDLLTPESLLDGQVEPGPVT